MIGIDLVVAGLLGLATVRGLFLGLVREAFSIASLGAGVAAARLLGAPAAEAIRPHVGPHVSEAILTGVGAVAAGLAALVAVRIAGFFVRRAIQAVGLGFVDRLGGGALGLVEGALVVALVLTIWSALAGASHPALAESRAFATYQELRRAITGEPGPAAPAAPPHDVAAQAHGA